MKKNEVMLMLRLFNGEENLLKDPGSLTFIFKNEKEAEAFGKAIDDLFQKVGLEVEYYLGRDKKWSEE